MIVERVEKDGIIKGYYDSSNVLASKYVRESKILTITFGSGRNYDYLDVPLTDFVRFEAADSQGKVLNSVIKAKYEVKTGDKTDLNLIKEELKVINNENLLAIEVDMKSRMEKIIDNDFESTIQIGELEKLFVKYLKKRNG